MSHELRRGQLLSVAEEIIRDLGAHGLTMERVAERVGIAKPVIYRHFASADALMLAVLQQHWTSLDRQGAVVAAVPKTLLGYLQASAARYFIEMAEERRRFGTLLAAVLATPAGQAAYRARFDARARHYARRLERYCGISPVHAYPIALMTVGGLTALGNMPQSPIESGDRTQAYVNLAMAMAGQAAAGGAGR